ncbi:hypothetical protein Sme01_47320 [Sphaerisporangium melleum]|uniref:Uncharacterized protein n=1 Tax=Sphaerisporangium melleum TaxID=321316 RepID=A0A917RQJ7_9ACTN|nr:hypothetical protein [Sphaerisporangium melleum]GGL19452.1 hypothetical protein GCM10007964_71850 [Sphaerisporangium melleum]GII72256.1 hypothetical protein Sme01_47320 [Sphaerisporangium melleum]
MSALEDNRRLRPITARRASAAARRNGDDLRARTHAAQAQGLAGPAATRAIAGASRPAAGPAAEIVEGGGG